MIHRLYLILELSLFIVQHQRIRLRAGDEIRVGLDPGQEERHAGVHGRHTDRATSSRSERHNTDLETATVLDGQRATRVTVAGRATTLTAQAHVLGLDQGRVPASNTVSIG